MPVQTSADGLHELAPDLARCVIDRDTARRFHVVRVAVLDEHPPEGNSWFYFGIPEETALAHHHAPWFTVAGGAEDSSSVWGDEAQVRRWFLERIEDCVQRRSSASDGEVSVSYEVPDRAEALQLDFSDVPGAVTYEEK
jgi:hypothetical protein